MRACAVEMPANISQGPLNAEFYRINAAPQNRGVDFVRACAVEMHINISQEPLCTEIYSSMPQPSWSTLSSTGLHPYREIISAWTHSVGKNSKQRAEKAVKHRQAGKKLRAEHRQILPSISMSAKPTFQPPEANSDAPEKVKGRDAKKRREAHKRTDAVNKRDAKGKSGKEETQGATNREQRVV